MTKILVVDDELAIGKLLLYQLQGYGYQVIYVSDGLLALQRLEQEQPDLILLDVMMPAMSGWDVCRQIRTVSVVPVIMLTGKHSDDDIAIGLGAGADDYIAKPFSMVQLHARIEAVLRRSKDRGFRGTNDRTMAYRATIVPEYREAAVQEGGEHWNQRRVVSTNQQSTLAHHTAPRIAVKDEVLSAPALPSSPAATTAPPQRLGQRLRHERLARGLSLEQVERECKIRWEFLQAIEQENFDYMPRSQLRIALHAYTSYLGLDLHTLLNRPQPPQKQSMPWHVIVLVVMLVLLFIVAFWLLRMI